ncbi:MAG: hypothetical protein AAF944_14555 [Bacteroidota bacterium]
MDMWVTMAAGKTRVSYLANKQWPLHTAALPVISGKGELAQYYQRKVAEGKSKMAVLNATAVARFVTS